jgi:hypothetical protein
MYVLETCSGTRAFIHSDDSNSSHFSPQILFFHGKQNRNVGRIFFFCFILFWFFWDRISLCDPECLRTCHKIQVGLKLAILPPPPFKWEIFYSNMSLNLNISAWTGVNTKCILNIYIYLWVFIFYQKKISPLKFLNEAKLF